MESCEKQVCEEGTQSRNRPERTPFESPAQFIADLTRVTTRGSARFGTFSHNPFFSRHNPHPHRVTHISGLNGSPVCAVNDDWYANTPLCPHPLIKSQVPAAASRSSLSLPHQLGCGGSSGSRHGAALLSEAWQEELKELATKVSLSASGPNKKDEGESCREEEPPRRKTQYSAQTGRIIPPTSWGAKRRDTQTSLRRTAAHRPQPPSLGGQELRVLELLCQILQTDSLSLVQQWLLLASNKEKELVLGLLQQAMSDAPTINPDQEFPFTALPEHPFTVPNLGQSRRKRRLKSSSSQEAIQDKPERMGDAEVLQVHQEEDQSIAADNSALHPEQTQ